MHPWKTIARARRHIGQSELDEIVRQHDSFQSCRVGGKRALLSYTDMTGLDLAGKNLAGADLTGALLADANLAGSDFSNATLSGCDLSRTNLRGARLVRTDLRGASMRRADLTGANLFDADLRDGLLAEPEHGGGVPSASSAAAVEPTELSGAIMAAANLSGARLSGIVAMRTDFRDAVMRSCTLVRANLRHANLNGANLDSADLSGADLRGADLRGAVLVHAVMSFVEDKDADFSGSLTDAPAGRLPAELGDQLDRLVARHRRWVETNGAEGGQLDVSGYDLRGTTEFLGASLAMLKASHATLFDVNFNGATLQAAQLDGADMRSSHLARVDLRGAKLGSTLPICGIATSDRCPSRKIASCALVSVEQSFVTPICAAPIFDRPTAGKRISPRRT
jgi:uncharacterized protein YjbI with pentapeptide repeats